MTDRRRRARSFTITEADGPLIAALSPEHQAVLRANGSYQAIAFALHLPIGTVKSRLHRAIKALVAARDDAIQCEGCGKVIAKGEKYTTTLDGCYLCEVDAPTIQDVVDFWNDHPPDSDEEREAKESAEKYLAAHLSEGGSPSDKPLWIME